MSYSQPSRGGYDTNNNAGYGGGGGGYRDAPNDNAYPMSGPAASAASPYAYKPEKKSHKKRWWTIGIIVLICVIVGAVLGGVLGSRAANNNDKDEQDAPLAAKTSAGGDEKAVAPTNSNGAGVGGTATGADGQNILAVSTDAYQQPVYPTGTATSGYAAPTAAVSAAAAWPTDPSPPSESSPRAHPRIGAPGYKWEALKGGLVDKDPYLKQWHQGILANADANLTESPVTYELDGGLTGSGLLDVARIVKARVKNWAYAYQMTDDKKYVDRTWKELQTAAGENPDVPFGDDRSRWNPQHFLDVAEFTAAYAIAYDWLNSAWTDEQKTSIRGWIIDFGLSYGQSVYNGTADGDKVQAWWAAIGDAAPITGNWNCVCNGGMVLGALAIVDEDTTGTASAILAAAPDNAKKSCMKAVAEDGTWAETPDYWYFGTTGAAEMISALNSAYGDDKGLLESAPQWNLTSMFHMYNFGMTSKFNWGDNGPNKYSSTANSLFLWADLFSEPRYALYQRDRPDAFEPWAMFWYNPAFKGAWWDNLPLDRSFDSQVNAWSSMRSSWTDNDGLFVAMRSGNLTGHETHGDLDVGDFVLDALGQRWAGEFGSGQYLSTDYFASEAQDAARWTYYTKMTIGQNTLNVNGANQLVSAVASHDFGTTGEAQGAAPGFTVPSGSSAFYTVDMSSAYSQG